MVTKISLPLVVWLFLPEFHALETTWPAEVPVAESSGTSSAEFFLNYLYSKGHQLTVPLASGSNSRNVSLSYIQEVTQMHRESYFYYIRLYHL